MSCYLCGKKGKLNAEHKDGLKTFKVHKLCKLEFENIQLKERIRKLEERIKTMLRGKYL